MANVTTFRTQFITKINLGKHKITLTGKQIDNFVYQLLKTGRIYILNGKVLKLSEMYITNQYYTFIKETSLQNLVLHPQRMDTVMSNAFLIMLNSSINFL